MTQAEQDLLIHTADSVSMLLRQVNGKGFTQEQAGRAANSLDQFTKAVKDEMQGIPAPAPAASEPGAPAGSTGVVPNPVLTKEANEAVAIAQEIARLVSGSAAPAVNSTAPAPAPVPVPAQAPAPEPAPAPAPRVAPVVPPVAPVAPAQVAPVPPVAPVAPAAAVPAKPEPDVLKLS